MGLDSKEYRRRFWREAYRMGRTIGHRPYGLREYGCCRGAIAMHFAIMGVFFL